jgi:hypothetical protein
LPGPLRPQYCTGESSVNPYTPVAMVNHPPRPCRAGVREPPALRASGTKPASGEVLTRQPTILRAQASRDHAEVLRRNLFAWRCATLPLQRDQPAVHGATLTLSSSGCLGFGIWYQNAWAGAFNLPLQRPQWSCWWR